MAYNFKIKVADKALDKEFMSNLSSIKLDQYVDRHHVLRIELHGLGAERDKGAFQGTNEFSGFLGETISVQVETDEVWNESGMVTAMEFIGIVTGINHENTVDRINTIVIIAHSPTIAMDGSKRNKIFLDQSASDVIRSVVGNHSLTQGNFKSTPGSLPYCVQYRETDYQFIMRLAGANGLFAYYDGSRFNADEAKTTSEDVDLMFGQMLYEFKMGLGTQTEKYASQAYDEVKKEVYDGDTSGSLKKSMSGLPKKSHDASKKIYPKGSFVPGLKPKSQSEMDKSLNRSREASVGRMVNCSGRSRDPRVKVGICVTISGMPSEFHGPHWIKSVGHRYTRGEYYNTFTCTPLETSYPVMKHLRTPFTDIQSAIVLSTEDPENRGRIKVRFEWKDDTGPAEPERWLRVATPHAGSEKGFFCLPEIDDEVLVAFEHGDPERPLVIGSLYNAKDKPPLNGYDASTNNLKIFRTKNGNEISFKDEDGSEVICITQECGNTITLSADGPKITIETDGDVSIKGKNISLESTSGDITLKSAKAVQIESAADTKIKASGNFSSEGGIKHESKGGATTEIKGPMVKVQGDAMTEIKGGIVKIN